MFFKNLNILIFNKNILKVIFNKNMLKWWVVRGKEKVCVVVFS